ncbi:hypothetical protein [Natronorubrum thiooxidans]|uniref:RING-type E3 ubiquitin transferase n=1 Tax=Natronorubrum thiooxidans TaxID=308853 RepID=A0A1N7DIK5_9EURY|nr:hypothetical protein [Natronorubrum thiooxidans]SIR75689.1 hypothetical protein SAMN05421752_102282 [Natronorubrum thiooxidans]
MSSLGPVAMGIVALFGFAILGGGLSIAAVGVGRLRTARALREAEPIPLGAVPEASGLVEFEGTVQPHGEETLEGPISGTTCLAYTVQSRTRDENGDVGESAWTFDRGISAGVPFAVDDGVDRLAVDPANAVLSLTDWGAEGTPWTDRTALSSDVLDRLQTAGLPEAGTEPDAVDSDPAGVTRRQYREHRLETGSDVHVFGGSVTDSSDRHTLVTVTGDDWFEITAGDEPTVLADRQRSGSLYLIFGGLLAVPGVSFALAGIVGLVSMLFL